MRLLLLFIICLCFLAINAQFQGCQFTLGDKFYDFSMLRSSQDYILTSNNTMFTLNLCGAIESSNLKDKFPQAGAVVQNGSDNYSLGDFSSMKWSAGTDGNNSFIVASYTGGDDGRNYQIHFECKQGASHNGAGMPEFVAEVAPKDFLFRWPTVYACDSQPHDCEVFYQNLTFNLAPLRNDSVDFKVQTDNMGTFFLNICGPLVDATVCGATNNEDDPVACRNYQNKQSVVATADGMDFSYNATSQTITATYFGGYQGETISYVILCDTNTTSPTYLDKFNNAFIFLWKSPVACTSSVTHSSKKHLGRN
jgi:hypothetical protein